MFSLLVELLPVDARNKIVLWFFAVFTGEETHGVYIKVVPSTSAFSPTVITFIIGLVFILLAKYISRKENTN